MINFWRRLTGILPTDPLRLGTIDTVNADNTVTCTLSNGGKLTVRGTGTVGDQVWIRDGKVQDTASGVTTFADQDV